MDEDDRRACLEALWATHASAVLAYARRRADRATADDVLSDVFTVAWRCLDDVSDDARAWLLACARRSLGNHRRAGRRSLRLLSRLAATSAPAAPPLTLGDGTLARALATLSERDREALLLTAWEGLSGERAAAVLGCSPQAFRVRAHRARQRLASALRAAEITPPPPTLEACND
jgi:RNA polymerase sigma-70 factor (ECF subfamily)